MPRGEEELTDLCEVDLCEEVRLILHRVRCSSEEEMLPDEGRRSVVPRSDKVVLMPPLLLEAAELNELVAHHIGVRGQPSAHRIYRVLYDTRPVLLMEGYDL